VAKTKTSFTSGTRKATKPRGRGKRNVIIDAMRESALAGVPKNATDEQVEDAWFKHLISQAIDSECKDAGLCLRLITERGWSALKPASECVKFEFDKDASTTKQASQVMDAVADGIIPPDLGIAFVSGIRSMIDIEANVELKARLEKLESIVNGNS
jgi:hypothetical protein